MNSEQCSFSKDFDMFNFFKKHTGEFKKMYEMCKSGHGFNCGGIFNLMKNQCITGSMLKGENK